ncbi:MAG: glycosyltransferase family 4 protein [Nitrospirae bacterium]|nr:glycosyltransferase family 4 protein [Candidatus Manganitrophaceae bacterium]
MDTSRGFGGQQEWILRLSAALIKSGHRVVLICRPDTPLARKGAERGIPLWTLSVRNSLDLRAVLSLARLICQEEVEVVHTHNAVTSWLAWFAGHAWPLVPRRPVLVRTRHLANKSRYRFPYRLLSDRVVAVSEYLRSYLVEELRLSPAKVVVSSPGIDTDLYRTASVERGVHEEFGIPSGVPVIGTVAFLRKEKGQSVLIEAAPAILARFPETRFLLVGSGGDEKNLRRQVREEGLEQHFIFTGYRSDIPRLLAAVDLFVAPSLKEALGISILEAMAMEKPVVASGVGGILEVISNRENGLLVPSGNAAALSAALLFLLVHPKRAEQLGRRARRTVEERYNLQHAVEQTVALYRHIQEEIRHGKVAPTCSDFDVPPREPLSR